LCCFFFFFFFFFGFSFPPPFPCPVAVALPAVALPAAALSGLPSGRPSVLVPLLFSFLRCVPLANPAAQLFAARRSVAPLTSLLPRGPLFSFRVASQLCVTAPHLPPTSRRRRALAVRFVSLPIVTAPLSAHVASRSHFAAPRSRPASCHRPQRRRPALAVRVASRPCASAPRLPPPSLRHPALPPHARGQSLVATPRRRPTLAVAVASPPSVTAPRSRPSSRRCPPSAPRARRSRRVTA
jgi:hypothetical protein